MAVLEVLMDILSYSVVNLIKCSCLKYKDSEGIYKYIFLL